MFKEDLHLANIEEEKLARRLIATGKYDGYKLNDTSDYDIRVFNHSPDGTKTVDIELKHDKHSSSRVAIELMCLSRLKLTGLLVTTADWFVILKNDTYYWIKPHDLKHYISSHDVVFTTGGDGRRAFMALIELKELAKITKVDTCG
jgi:hypothetical protein